MLKKLLNLHLNKLNKLPTPEWDKNRRDLDKKNQPEAEETLMLEALMKKMLLFLKKLI